MHLRPGSKFLIRDLNTNLVLEILRRYGPCPRAEVVDRTRLGRSTVSEILGALDREGMLAYSGRTGSTGGRPAELVRLAPLSRLAAGFSVSPSGLSGVLLDLYGLPVARYTAPVSPGFTPLQLAGSVKTGLLQLTRDAGVEAGKLAGAGVALPGLVDPAAGMVIQSYTLGWTETPLRLLLEEVLQMPAAIANDAQSMALAERCHGPRPGAEAMVGVLISQGVGAGIIAGGQLYRGASASVGELGHAPIRASGRRCTCGRKGCLQTVASEPAVLEAAGLPLAFRGPLPETAAVSKALEEAGQALGLGLAFLINLLNPGLIIVGGRLAGAAGPLLLEPLRASLRSHALPAIAEATQVLPARLGEEACAIGAGVAMLEEFFRPPLYESRP